MRYALFTFILILVATPALAAAGEQWDANGDGVVGEQAWDAAFAESGTFAKWDSNGDGEVSKTEWDRIADPDSPYAALAFDLKDDDGDITEEEWDETFAGSDRFDEWDVDGDGVVDESEYSTGLFGTFDANSDSNITEEEWDDQFGNASAGLDRDWFDIWDVNDDGVLDQNEVSAGLYDYHDADDDGLLGAAEWEEEGLFDI